MALPHSINSIALTLGTSVALPVGALITVAGFISEATGQAVEALLEDGLVPGKNSQSIDC